MLSHSWTTGRRSLANRVRHRLHSRLIQHRSLSHPSLPSQIPAVSPRRSGVDPPSSLPTRTRPSTTALSLHRGQRSLPCQTRLRFLDPDPTPSRQAAAQRTQQPSRLLTAVPKTSSMAARQQMQHIVTSSRSCHHRPPLRRHNPYCIHHGRPLCHHLTSFCTSSEHSFAERRSQQACLTKRACCPTCARTARKAQNGPRRLSCMR